MAEPYRFGGPISESVQRMKARRIARAVVHARAEPMGVSAFGMPILRGEVAPAATQSLLSRTADGVRQP